MCTHDWVDWDESLTTSIEQIVIVCACERRTTIRRNKRWQTIEDGNTNIDETRAIGRKYLSISEEIYLYKEKYKIRLRFLHGHIYTYIGTKNGKSKNQIISRYSRIAINSTLYQFNGTTNIISKNGTSTITVAIVLYLK
jgi:hypothetical protein